MMNYQGVDPQMLEAWLSARSLARGLPAPIPEYGGFRVDTQSDAEVARWVFPKLGPGLAVLARSINKPRYFLKLCGTAEELQSALLKDWEIHAPRYFMKASRWSFGRTLANGYKIEVRRTGTVLKARILFETGALAASGYAAEIQDFFIYDRIVTEPEHRRKGLGQVLMQTLHENRQQFNATELLIASEDGQALYLTLGWETLSPYSTASIGEA